MFDYTCIRNIKSCDFELAVMVRIVKHQGVRGADQLSFQNK